MTGRVLITGGTGNLGRELIPRSRERGWTVRVMSRRPAPPAESGGMGDRRPRYRLGPGGSRP
jgi:uncharacterized protein YbjT (DUF2867 family)